MEFRTNPTANLDGSSLHARASYIEPTDMVRTFGVCHMHTLDNDKGYHDGEWYFTSDAGAHFMVYFRKGICDINTFDGNKDQVPAFIAWLTSRVSESRW